jgi:SNF2 family DNA or RNA helicase
MTKMLDLLQSYLEQLGHTACRIDGSIPWQERQEAIRSFNEDNVGAGTWQRGGCDVLPIVV